MMILLKNRLFLLASLGYIFILTGNAFALGEVDASYFAEPIEVPYISPSNQDGIQDNLEITLPSKLAPSDEQSISKVIFLVYDFSGDIKFKYEGSYDPTRQYYYGGQVSSNDLLENGIYFYNLVAYYDDGGRRRSKPYPFIIDSTAPEKLSVTLDISVDDFVDAYSSGNINAALLVKNSQKEDMMNADSMAGDDMNMMGEDQGDSLSMEGSNDMSMLSSDTSSDLDINNLPTVYFGPYSDNIFFTKRNYDPSSTNMEHIRKIATFLRNNPEYTIKLVGHAPSLTTGDLVEQEQIEELIPLSRRRAESVKLALILLGIEPTRITTEAVGKNQPVPSLTKSDKDYYVKNRRVEFFMSEK